MSDYCVLGDLKSRLTDISTDHDAILASLATTASAIVDLITQRADGFGQVTATRTFDSPDWITPAGGRRLFIGDVVSVSKVRVKAATTSSWQVAANPVPPIADPAVAPGAAAGAAGPLTGAYLWSYTWVTAQGETGPSPDAAAAPAAQQGALTGIAVGPAGTTARRIYRTAAGGATATKHLAGTLANNTTTVFTDALADVEIAAAALQPVTNTTGRGGDYLVRPRPETGLPGRFLQLSDIPSSVLGFGTGFDSVEVTAVWGWPAIPDAVKEAAIEIAISLWRSRGSGEMDPMGISTLSQGNIPRAIPPLAYQILRQYRRVVFA